VAWRRYLPVHSLLQEHEKEFAMHSVLH
jgi:hypothetical protein